MVALKYAVCGLVMGGALGLQPAAGPAGKLTMGPRLGGSRLVTGAIFGGKKGEENTEVMAALEALSTSVAKLEGTVTGKPLRLVSKGAKAATPATPDDALKALKEGNQRFINGDIEAPNRGMDRLAATAGGQNPFAAILSCADSRVPVEILFDQGFGDLFVTRVAGNIVTTELTGSLEFGTAVLGSKVLVVLGHSACGAVAATLAGAAVPGVISSLYYNIKQGVDASGGNVDAAIAENVKFQVKALGVSPVLKGLVNDGKLKIVGAVYDLATGRVNYVC